ncbi:hypothetical protein Cfor_02455 [Coptotermes formosanus]|jgi:hypothetical protein|uniref:Uncharacterized protein n=1 Tax=Coptotermes formosanus TaxID=36987 RepID=A0A6L2PEF1_COPFO|nr:hypothetical protein Cfor_02455 [Coptotermes formosanus]
MREIGRGGSSSGKERGAGVTVAAAVAILERQQEEQRRTAPPVRHRLRGDLNRITEAGISRDSSDSSVSSVGETIARLQNRFSADVVAGNVVSSADKELKQHTDAKSVKHVTRPNRNEFISGRTKEPDNSDVKTKRVVTERERGVHEIRKSPSTKNISSLVRNNSVVSTLNTEALSPLDSKTQDVRKCVGDGTHGGVSDLSLSDGTQFIVSENTSSSEQTYRSELSASNTGSDPSNLQSSSSAKDVLDHHDDSDDEGIGAASLRSDTLDQPQITLKGFPSDDNIPRKRPRIIHLRDTGSKDKRPKSNTVAASRTDRQQAQSVGEAGLLSSNSSVNIVLEYPPPPPSLPPEYGSCGRPLSGGTSASNSRWILASTDSLGSSMHDRTVTH